MDTSITSCHHSLVSPIDWKLASSVAAKSVSSSGHHSLVTPIDWKLELAHS